MSKTTSSPPSREIISMRLITWIDQDWMSQLLVQQYLVKHRIRILILNLISLKLITWIDQGTSSLTSFEKWK
jgi:hypothetical protein